MLAKTCFLLLTAMLGVLPIHGKSLTNNIQQQELQQVFESLYSVEKIMLTAPATQTYQLMKMKQNWAGARGVCRYLGGDLASLLSYKLIKEIHDQVAMAVPGESVWLGGFCSPSDANGCENARHTTGWRWLTGEQIALKENGNGQWKGSEPAAKNQYYYLNFDGYSAAGQPALYAHTGSTEWYFLCEF